MPLTTLAGTRIRDRRVALGLKQAELAQKVEISASYLNLIEHNKRRIGGKLLTRLAGGLQTTPMFLSGGGVEEAVRKLQALANPNVEEQKIVELVSSFPGWAKLIEAQATRIDELEDIISGLNDRLTHDPVLSEKMHEVLGAVSAIRSTAAILVSTPEIAPDWRARFHTNIDQESRKLSESSAAMATHFDRLSRDESGFSTPLETIGLFLEARRHHIAELEEGGSVDEVLSGAPELRDLSDQAPVRKFLETYLADVGALPLAEFSQAAQRLNFDPGALADFFQADLVRVFRRLASLPLAPDLPEIGFVSCDAAGAILIRKSPTGFSLPRFGTACPIWPLFQALSAPGQPIYRVIESGEERFFDTYSIAAPIQSARFDLPPVHHAAMLLIARPDDDVPAKPLAVGSSCRVCAREACFARREPSVLSVKQL